MNVRAVTSIQIVLGHGLYVDGSDVLLVLANSAVMYEDLGCVARRPLKGVAAVERVLDVAGMDVDDAELK